MIDSEIIKALEVCTTKGKSCKNCPAYVKVDRSNCKEAFRGALNLINRQKAEIESLKDTLKIYHKYNSVIRYTKTKTIKEVIERVKTELPKIEEFYLDEECGSFMILTTEAMDLLERICEEMVGDSDG